VAALEGTDAVVLPGSRRRSRDDGQRHPAIRAQKARSGPAPGYFFATAEASSASMSCLNASMGWALTSFLPLMKNVGVPSALAIRPVDDGHRRVLGAAVGRVAHFDPGGELLRDLARRPDVLGDEHLVELLRLDALLQRGVRLLDLLVDQRLEGLERHGAGDE